MSHIEAIEDNIKCYKDKRGYNWYEIPCCNCDKFVNSWGYKRGLKYFCDDCKQDVKMEEFRLTEPAHQLSKDRKLANALKRLEKMGRTLSDYESATSIIKRKLYTRGWFQSTEEIMVALELLKNKIKFYHQQKILRYKCDFVLPDEKVVLEVDGSIFHTKDTQKQEYYRDLCIVNRLGPEWEVVRIKDNLINQNIKRLVKAIRAVYNERQRLRKKNNGLLPENYALNSV